MLNPKSPSCAPRQVHRLARRGAGAERPGDRADPSRRRPHRRARGRGHRGPALGGRAQPGGDGGPAPALRLPLRAGPRARHRPAAQPRQERDGGVAGSNMGFGECPHERLEVIGTGGSTAVSLPVGDGPSHPTGPVRRPALRIRRRAGRFLRRARTFSTHDEPL